MKNIKRIIAMVLVLIMVITSNTSIVTVLAEETAEAVNSKEKVEIPFCIPEDAEDRDKHVKRLKEDENEYMAIFENEDGTKTVYSFSSPIQYKDANGKLVDYDSRLKEVKNEEKKNNGYAYEITSSDVSVMVPEDLASDKYITLEKDEYKIDFKPLTESSNSEKVKDEYKAKEIEIQRDKSINKDFVGVEYLSPDSDSVKYKYYVTDRGIKEDIILDEKPATNILKYEIELKNVEPEVQEEGNIVFNDTETGELVGSMSPFFMYDSYAGNGDDEEDMDGPNISDDIKVEIEKDKNNENKYIMTVYLDEKFLNSKDTVYPITVDPTLIFNGYTDQYHDTYVYSGRNANYNSSSGLKVGKGSGIYRTYIRFAFPSSYNPYNVASASMRLYNTSSYTTAAYVDVHRVTGYWHEATTCWSVRAAYSSTIEYTALVNKAGYFWFNVTNLVRNWSMYDFSGGQEGYSNSGLMLKERNEYNRLRTFCSEIYYLNYRRPYLTITYSQDNVAPGNVTNLDAVANGGALNSGEGSITVTWPQATDTGTPNVSGMDEYELRLYEGTVSTGTQVGSTVTVDHDGSASYTHTFDNLDDNITYVCTIRARDNANNLSGTTQSSAVTLPDRTGPTAPTSFTIDPADWTNNTTPTIAWTGITDDSLGNIDIEYTLDSGTTWILSDWDGLSGNGTFSDSIFNADGEYSIQIRGKDPEGNIGDASSTVTYKKDTTLPTGEITSPVSNRIDGNVEIKGNISDELAGSGIDSWNIDILELSNESMVLETASLPAENQLLATWDTSSIPIGNYTVVLTVCDNAGNETTDQMTLTKYTVGSIKDETLVITSPINGTDFTNASQTQIPVTYTWSGGDVNTLKGKVYVDGVLVAEETTPGSGSNINMTDFAERESHNIFVIGEGTTNTECNEDMYERIFADDFNTTPIAVTDGTVHTQDRIVLDDVNGVYIGSGNIISDFSQNNIIGYVYKVELTVNETNTANTNIEYFISFDDGNEGTWQSITPNTPIEMFAKPDPNIKVKAQLSTSNGLETPELLDWSLKVNSVYAADLNTFTVNLVGVPTNLTATPNVNYMTLVDWDDDINGAGTLYNVYRIKETDYDPNVLSDVIIAENSPVAENVDQTFWYDYNLEYGEEFRYIVTAVKTVGSIARESAASDYSGKAKIVEENEINKNLGLQDYWRYSSFRTGSGNGYINVAGGNMVYNSVDSVYPGILFAMVMRRTYNSQATSKTTLGYGWDFSYNTCLLKYYDDNGQEEGMILKDGDGSLHYFTVDQANPGNYDAPAGVFMKLKYDSATEGYIIERKDGISYIFDENMKLNKMTENDRNYIQFEYDESGKLSRVSNNRAVDSNGSTDQVIFFYYQSADSNASSYTTDEDKVGLVAQMIDPAGRVYNYTYYDNGYLQIAELDIPNDANDYEEEYVYLSGTHKITDIYDGENNRTQIEYTSEKASKVTLPNSDYYTLSYAEDVTKNLFDGTTDTFNTTTITDNWQHSTEYAYESSNGCVRILKNALGDDTEYRYNNDRQVVKVSYKNEVGINSVLTTLNTLIDYNSNGNIEKITNPLGNDTEYTYDSIHVNEVETVTTKMDADTEVVTTNTYYSNGDLETTSVKSVLVANGAENLYNTTTYTYYSTGNIHTTTSSLGSKTEYLYYDVNDPNHPEYNGWVKEVKQGPSSGTLTTVSEVFEYDTQGNAVVTADGEDNRTKVVYDILGRATTTYLPDDTKTVWTDNKFTETDYDMNHNVVYTKDVSLQGGGSQGLETQFVYDNRDRLQSASQDPNGLDYTSTVSYNTYTGTDGKTYRKVISTDSEGSKAIEYYDALGRTVKTAISDGTTEIVTATYEYDRLGNMISVIDGDGVEVNAKYDELNRQICTIVDPNDKNITNSVEYNYTGQVVKSTDGEGYITDYEYDALGRIKKVTQDPDPVLADSSDDIITSYTYDESTTAGGAVIKNTITHFNEGSYYDSETYLDAYGRSVLEIKKSYTTGVSDMQVTSTYDNNGNLKTMTHSDGSTDYYYYNEWGQIEEIGYGEAIPTGGDIDNQTVYTYTNQGKLQTMTDTREDVDDSTVTTTVTTSWAYDTLGRLDAVVQDGNEVDYGYNTAGQVTSVKFCDVVDFPDIETSTIGYTYDDYGRLEFVKHRVGADTEPFRDVREYIYETGKAKLDYTVDHMEFETSGTNKLVTDYEFNDIGQVSAIKYYDTVSFDQTTTPLESYGYTYDDRGYIVTEDIDSSYTQNSSTVTTDIYKTHEYDGIGRLVQSDVTVDGTTTTTTNWTYDNVGNRLTQDNGTDSYTYSYNEFNQLTQIYKNSSLSTQYQYDARGAQVSEIETGGTTTNYTYDAAGRLAKTENGTASETTKHFFNGDGQRIRQVVNPGTNEEITKYYYTGSELLFTTNGGNGKLTENILTPDGSIIARQDYATNAGIVYTSGYYFYNYDIRQSTTNIIDSAYELLQGYTYDEFGNQEVTTSASFTNEVTFTGAITDTTGLHYMNSRFYNPDTGRFLTQDTYKGNAYEPMSQHLYSYVGNNPINYIDPTGHNATPAALIDGGRRAYVASEELRNRKIRTPEEYYEEKLEEAVGGWLDKDIEFVEHISTTNIPNNGDSYIQDQTDAVVSYGLGVVSGGVALLIALANNARKHETVDVYKVGGTYTKKYYCRTLINSEHKDVQGVAVPFQYSYVTVYFNSPYMTAEDIEYIRSQNDGSPRGAYND